MFNLIYHPEDVSSESFLVNHSREYHLAVACSILEYLVEKWFLFDFKGNFIAFYIGLPIVLIGQITRTLAMITAGSNFQHIVQDGRTLSHNHALITYGIYQHLRHPSYFGFFWWGVGTQILMFNPLCAAFYAMYLWNFFKDRIEQEEQQLIIAYPDDYLHYRKRTPVWIPLIN